MERRGPKTTEFWISGLTIVGIAILSLLVGYGALTQREAELWQDLLVAVLAIAVPAAAMAYASKGYAESRAKVKAAEAISKRESE